MQSWTNLGIYWQINGAIRPESGAICWDEATLLEQGDRTRNRGSDRAGNGGGGRAGNRGGDRAGNRGGDSAGSRDGLLEDRTRNRNSLLYSV